MIVSNKLEEFHSLARRNSVTKKLCSLMREELLAENRANAMRALWGRLFGISADDAPETRVGRKLNIFPILTTPDTLSVLAFACDDEGHPDPKLTWHLYFEFVGEDIVCMRLGSEMAEDCAV